MLKILTLTGCGYVIDNKKIEKFEGRMLCDIDQFRDTFQIISCL